MTCQRCGHGEYFHDDRLGCRLGCQCAGYIEEIDQTPLPEFPRGAA